MSAPVNAPLHSAERGSLPAAERRDPFSGEGATFGRAPSTTGCRPRACRARRASRWRLQGRAGVLARPPVGPQVLWLGCCPHRHLQASPTDRVGWRAQSSSRVAGLSENAEATRARGHGSVMTRLGGADKPLAWGSEPVPDRYSDVRPQSSVRQHRCRMRARDRALWSLLLGASRQQWSSP